MKKKQAAQYMPARWRLPSQLSYSMKIGTLALTGIFLSISALAFPQRVTIKMENATLKQFLEHVQTQVDVALLYSDQLIANKRITVNTKNRDFKEVLSKELSKHHLTFKESDGQITIVPNSSYATSTDLLRSQEVQQHTVTGVVRNAAGEILKGVSVIESGGPGRAITDENGTFSLKVSTAIPILIFTYLGFERLELKADQAKIEVFMKEVSAAVDEVVVVGYRAIKRDLVNGSVSTVNMVDKEKQTLTHASQALYGTSGLWINQAGAKPGKDATTIRIRGVNTLNNANPLVLLDGIEYNFDEIDPADIETITVLKDASAAIYGSKSSNGVILITSKKGHAGKTKIELRSHTGIQQASFLPKVVNDPILYMQMRNRAEANSGKAALSYTQEQIDEYRSGMGTDPSVYPASNWFDIALDNGFLQQYNARVSGGGDKYTFTVGGGYMNQQGIFIANDDAKRYSFDVKVSAQATPRLKINAGIIGNLREFNEVGYGTGTVFGVIMRGLPIISDYHKNNLYGASWLYTPGRNNVENPRMEVEQGFTYRDYQETLTNFNIAYKLPLNLTYHSTLGYRRVDHFSKDFIPQMYTVDPKTGDIKNFNSTAPRIKDWDSLEKQFTLSHRLVFEKELGQHNIHAMFGQDYQINDGRGFQAYNWGFYDNSLYELNALSDQTNAQATGGSSKDILASLYSRVAYDYQQKYMVEGSLRYDGSSRFAPGNQWALFPSMSLGWMLSKEDFFNSKAIERLKIRGSLGKLGNQAVTNGAYNSTVNINNSYNYSFGGVTAGGAATSALADRNIRWESTTAYNIGLDINLWNKLNITGDYFYKRTYDILRAIAIPSQVGGLSGPTVNLGKVDNEGWELAVDYADQVGLFNYGIQGSVSYVKNKVIDIADQQIISGRYIIKEGHSINSYYLYQADGYYQNQAEIDNAQAVYGTRSKLRPGYIRYNNNNGDNYIDDADKIVTGSTIPDYNYGFSASLGYGQVMLDAQFQGVANVDVYPTGNVAFPFNNGAGVTEDWARDSWTPSNPQAELPLLTTYTDASENFINSTFWLRDASYLRMKNISLTYNLPLRWLERVHIAKAALYISGQNLLTWSKFKMWDPELTTTKGDLYEYPNLKSYSIGLNLNF
ncbi:MULTISPECIES: TonB-dependent receptor [Sphingobacterium]|uniref:TonB-dependent receptor n=1 Tax=Sphingobacterium TaxID=28453 RepID=UPI0013DD1962|nr:MULTISPECIES: TonB-dependent receptor [unclassified Sphingobacterium]